MKYFQTGFLFLLLATTAFLFTSCNKKEDPKAKDKAAVTATIKVGSDNPYHFTYDPVAMTPAIISGPNQEGFYNLKMIFVEVKPSKTITIIAYIKDEGTYHFDTNSNGENFLSVLLSWKKGSGPQSHFYTFPIMNDPVIGNATLTIISLKENRIKGTFSGTLYTMTGEKAVIEDGKFDVGVSRL